MRDYLAGNRRRSRYFPPALHSNNYFGAKMITATRYWPPFVDGPDENVPVPILSLQELLALPWVQKWENSQNADFKFNRWVTSKANVLYAEMWMSDKSIFKPCLIALINDDPDRTIVGSLPVTTGPF